MSDNDESRAVATRPEGNLRNALTDRITGEQLPVTRAPNDFQPEIEAMIQTAGTLVLSAREKEVLFAPVNDADVEIRPDGLVYLPWMEYAGRLRDAFGCEWALIPQGLPKIQGQFVMWGFHFIIRGKLMAYAIGQQEYSSANSRMTWGDACEGAKSNALMRVCKGIGVSLELWQPSFVRTWKEKCAEQYEGKDARGNPKTLWRKKGTIMPEDFGLGSDTTEDLNPRGAEGSGDEPPAPGQAPGQVVDHKREIGRLLLEMTEGDEVKAMEMLSAMTSFKGKDGSTISVRSLKDPKFSPKWANSTIGRVRKAHAEWRAKQPATPVADPTTAGEWWAMFKRRCAEEKLAEPILDMVLAEIDGEQGKEIVKQTPEIQAALVKYIKEALKSLEAKA